MRMATRRVAWAAAIALALSSSALVSSPVSAADCPDPTQSCVVVTVVATKNFIKTEKKYAFTAEQVAQSSTYRDPAYFTRRKAGADPLPTPRPSKVLPLRDLLSQIAQADPDQATLLDAVTFSEAPDETGLPKVLDKPAFGDPSPANADYPFDDDLPAAVYVKSDGRITYFRPLTGEDDVNAPDRFEIDGRLNLTIHTTGRLLAPTASVSNSAPTTKDETTFSVSLSDKPGTRLKYLWDYGDGRTADRAKKSPSHRYPTKGSYGAFVSVFGADGSYGRSAVVAVEVATPPKPQPTAAPDTGGGGGGSIGGGYVPPYLPPTTSLPEPDDAPVEIEPTEPAPVDDGLEEVEGYVLAGSDTVPGGIPETIPGTQASSQPTSASSTSTRKRVATWAVVALGTALLVSAGAASETRWFRNRLSRVRRRV